MSGHWQRKKLSEVAQVDWGDTSITKAQYVECGVPAYSAAGPDGFVADAQHEGEGVVVSAIGARCGRCFLATGRWTAIKNTIVVLPDERALLTRFFYQVTQANNIWPIDGGAQPFIGIGKAYNLEILLPTLPEQRRIATVLEAWDRALAGLEKLLAVKQQRKQALMQQLLTGKKRFPGFEGQPWRQVRLGDALKEVERPIPWKSDTLYHLLSVRRRSGGLFSRESLHGREIKTQNLRVARMGDFLISRMQVVHGASGLTTQEFDGMTISGSYDALVTKDPNVLDIEFFNFLSQRPQLYRLAFLASHGVHIEKMSFNLEHYLKLKIRIPPTVVEQRKIVALLNGCNRELKLLSREADLLRDQKKGLMQQLLTGKVRVKG